MRNLKFCVTYVHQNLLINKFLSSAKKRLNLVHKVIKRMIGLRIIVDASCIFHKCYFTDYNRD